MKLIENQTIPPPTHTFPEEELHPNGRHPSEECGPAHRLPQLRSLNSEDIAQFQHSDELREHMYVEK